MPIAHLLQQFDALGPQGPRASILIDQAFTGSTELINQFRAVLGTSSVSLNAVTDATQRGDDSLELVGSASLLGLTDAQVRFLARDKEGQLLVTLELVLPSGWSFGTLFPEVPSFMTRLGLGAGKLVFSSAAHFDEKLACALVPGLNFAGELYFTGDLLPIGSLLEQRTPTLITGPVNEYRFDSDPLAFTGIRLTGPVALGFSSMGPVKVKDARLFIKSGLTASQRDKVISATQQPGTYLLVSAELGGRPFQMVGTYDSAGTREELRLYGRFEDFAFSGFSSLNQTLGVDGLEEEVPKDMPVPKGIALTELGLALDFARHEVKSLMVGVGAQTSWDLLPDVAKLQEVGITLSVTNPFDKSRSLSTTLSGLLAFQKFDVVAFVELPSLDFGAGLPGGCTLPLGDVIESLIPGETGLPALTITQLLMQASPQARSFSLSAAMEDLLSIPVGATAFEVSDFNLLVGYAKAGGATGTVTAQLRMGEATVLLSGEARGGVTLSGSLKNFELKKFWSLVTNGESLPDEVPDILFETLNILVNTKTGAFSVMGNASVAWDHLGGDGALQTNAQFSLTRNVSGSKGTQTSAFSASLSLQGQGPVKVAEGFSLQAFNLLFDYQTGGGWKLSGGMGASVFDTRLDLQAGYETTQAVRKIKLRATAAPAAKLIDVSGVGSCSFSQFDLLLDRRTGADGKKKTFFDLRLASTLALEQLFTLGGYLSLSDTAEGKSALLFKPNPQSTAFHLDLTAGMGIGGELFEIGFVKESASTGWSFTGTTSIGFTGFPGGLGKMLPSKVTAKLVAGRTDVRISALNVTAPIELALPTVQGKSLGKVTVQLTELGLSIKPKLGLVLEAGLGMPAELNTYLGAQLFRVYQKGNPVSMSRTRFTISGPDVAVRFVSSPFAAANTVMVNGDTWFDVDFGQYGALRLKMPTFLYDGVTQYFEAGGGCQVTRPLALPLAPLKLFLEACGGKAMADIFPDKLPIEGLSLVDKNDDLKIDDLVTFLKKAGDVPKEVTTALKQAGKVLNRFPDGFKSYLKLEVPERLDFKFGFSPTGRISLALLASEKPIRVLFPSVVQSYVPMPGLTGLELRKLSVGTLMSGSLFYGEVDAVIDQFDVPSLALSLMLPRDPDFPLPTSNQLQRRVILDDVFCIIPVSQGLPIPIPVFYDELGFEYLGIEGLGLQAHVGFPKPKLDGAAAMALFKTFDTFFNDRKALLDPKTPPGGVELGFAFHDEFLQAPEYLGGGVLGTKGGKPVTVGSWKYVAAMMNFGKTFSLNDCISAIPLENRAGSAQYKFAFMKFDADWLLTTPSEFKQGSFQRLKLSASDCADFMTVLPSVGSTPALGQKGNEEGLVTFVRGKADLGFMSMSAAFGLAASGSMGFNTGFKLKGAFGNTELELSGAVMVNAPLASTTTAATVLQSATATSTPAALPAPKAAQPTKALSFNGKNSWIELPASDSLVLLEYTIELWLKPSREQGSEWAGIFGKHGGGQRNNFLSINSKDACYHHRFTDGSDWNAGPPNTPNGSVQWGQWQHVAITNDGVTAKTYVNGKEAASGPVTGKLALSKQPLFIGKVDTFWKGEIAEVRIWKRARGAGEIENQMRELLRGDEKDLVSLYRFDEATGQRVVDVCGRNHGTVQNGSLVETDLLWLGGLAFNGKSDYAEVLDSQSLRLGAYTAEVWLKPSRHPEDVAADTQAAALAAQQAAFNAMKAMGIKPPSLPPMPEYKWKGVFGKKGRNYALFLRGNGLVHHRFHSAAGWNDGAPDTAEGAIKWDKWNHIAITNDGKVARTFVNGIKRAEGPVTGTLVIDNEKLTIGRSADGSDDAPYLGEIAEIRLWSRARAPDELTGNMYRRLDGKDPSLVSLWRFSEAQGNTLIDSCGRNAGRLSVAAAVGAAAALQATSVTQGTVGTLVKAPAEPARAAIQIQGHTHLTVAGRKVMRGDLRLVDDQFWFTGQLDLFPKDWPLQVTGYVEGFVSKQRFSLNGETRNALFGLTLSESRLFMTQEQLRLEGRWLGAFLKLDVSWDKDNPRFAGAVGFRASPRLDFGTIRIGGVKVADNFRISLDIGADVAVVVSRQGLAGKVTAKFQINGKGFDVSLSFDVAPADLAQLFNWIKQRIIDAPEKYLAHLFTDAVTWLKNVVDGTIQFARHVGEAVGGVLKSIYKQSEKAAANLMKNAGYAANQVGDALSKAYGVAAKEATEILKGLDYAAEDVGQALQSAYNTTADTAASLMKGAGYGAKEVGKALTSAYNKTSKECENILKSVHFSSKDIKGAVDDIGKGISNVGNSAVKGITSLF